MIRSNTERRDTSLIGNNLPHPPTPEFASPLERSFRADKTLSKVLSLKWVGLGACFDVKACFQEQLYLALGSCSVQLSFGMLFCAVRGLSLAGGGLGCCSLASLGMSLHRILLRIGSSMFRECFGASLASASIACTWLSEDFNGRVNQRVKVTSPALPAVRFQCGLAPTA